MEPKKEEVNLSRLDETGLKRVSLAPIEGHSVASACEQDEAGRLLVSEVQDMDHILTMLKSGPWNITIWVICSFGELPPGLTGGMIHNFTAR